MQESWPDPSPRVQELFRRAAEVASQPRQEWLDEVHEAALDGPVMRQVREDPVLARRFRDGNVANVAHWAAANREHPGRRVPVAVTPEVLETSRDLVRRGLDASALEAYRTGQSVAWRRWMEVCFTVTSDAGELRELLDISSLSISTFLDDTIASIAEQVAVERHELTQGTHAERLATSTLILEGAPISRGRAEAQLGYALTGPHTAAIIWDSGSERADHLENAAEALLRASAAPRRLTVLAGAGTLWVWLPVTTRPRVRDVLEHLAADSGTRIALGRPGIDLAGFRRSHLDASAAQRMLVRLDSPRRVVRYEDAQLTDVITADPAAADDFVTDVLGGLATADLDTRAAVLTYIEQECNTSRTAQCLFTHRNTVVRRLARADDLLPRPLSENLVAVAAALTVLSWCSAQA
ncbi:PucR family transcriptional regulator [Nocardia testacea]|uniref:PucR family transcriptional regulator n=1 Tax=Nocardia testacea TaxID=248551 RepID=UPI003C30C84D